MTVPPFAQIPDLAALAQLIAINNDYSGIKFAAKYALVANARVCPAACGGQDMSVISDSSMRTDRLKVSILFCTLMHGYCINGTSALFFSGSANIARKLLIFRQVERQLERTLSLP